MDSKLPDAQWSMEGVRGDRMTTTVDNLTPETDYTFKIQAVNEIGYSPVSSQKVFRTSFRNSALGSLVFFFVSRRWVWQINMSCFVS